MSEKMRDSFAKWYGEQAQYGKAHEDELWQAWQASRAALAVDLPEKAALMRASSVYAALDDAGVGYK